MVDSNKLPIFAIIEIRGKIWSDCNLWS